MPAEVWIRTNFPAFHQWLAAKGRAGFLANVHRHIFHVEMHWPVEHDDRDIEFITTKAGVDEWIHKCWWGMNLGSTSCEMMARELMVIFDASKVTVSEDNENGATVYAE